MHALRNLRADMVAGAVIFLVGCSVCLVAAQYPIGTPTRMGPGFYPVGLGIIITLLGLLLIFEGLRGERVDDVLAKTPRSMRAILAVLTSLVAFAEILPRFGLVPATFALVIIMALGDPVRRSLKTLLTATGLSVVSVLIFIVMFNMAMDAFRLG